MKESNSEGPYSSPLFIFLRGKKGKEVFASSLWLLEVSLLHLAPQYRYRKEEVDWGFHSDTVKLNTEIDHFYVNGPIMESTFARETVENEVQIHLRILHSFDLEY